MGRIFPALVSIILTLIPAPLFASGSHFNPSSDHKLLSQTSDEYGYSNDQTIMLASRDMEELLLFFEEEEIFLATKSSKKVGQAPAIATVITDEQIRDMGARTILDVLKTVPGIGISVSVTSAQGLRAIESRGVTTYGSEKVLIMIDGHSINNVFWGGATYTYFDMMVENIQRIEIIRGPGSALYGANAFVAVINIVTKDALDINGIDARIGSGSFNREHYNLLVGKEISAWKLALSLDYLNTDGAREKIKSDFIGQSGKTDDWKEKYDFALKLSYKDFSFKTRYGKTRKGFFVGVASVLNDESEQKQTNFFAEANYKKAIGKTIKISARGYYDHHATNNWLELYPEGTDFGFAPISTIDYPDGVLGSPRFKTQASGTEVQSDFSLNEVNTLTAGILYEHLQSYDVRHVANFDPNTLAPLGSVQDISSWGNFSKEKHRMVTAAYLQDVWKFTSTLEGTFGVRYDHYSDFGDTTNPRVGLVWNFVEKGHLKLLYGSAFRAPSFIELYNANNPVSQGNENLDPEEIDTYEASLGYRFNDYLRADISLFRNNIRNLISTTGIGPSGQFQNEGDAEIDGVETELKFNMGALGYGYMNHTYQNAEDPDTGERLRFVAMNKGNIGINLALSHYLNFNANLLAVGPKPRESQDPRPHIDPYEVVDATLIAKNLLKNFELRLSIYNLFNEKYEDPSNLVYNPALGKLVPSVYNDFPRERRSFFTEMRYKF